MGLTTYATVKAELGLTDDTQQTYIERLINVASQKIENYCNRKFNLTTYTLERYTGDDTNKLALRNYPVAALTRVIIDDTEIVTSTLILDAIAGLIDYKDSLFYSDTLKSGIAEYPELYQKNIQVTYTAGFATIPYDLEEVCIKEVVSRYENKGTAKNLKSWSLGNVSKTYSEQTQNGTGLLQTSKNILDNYYKRFIL